MSNKTNKQSESIDKQLSIDFTNIASSSIQNVSYDNNLIKDEGARIIMFEPRKEIYRRILNRLSK